MSNRKRASIKALYGSDLFRKPDDQLSPGEALQKFLLEVLRDQKLKETEVPDKTGVSHHTVALLVTGNGNPTLGTLNALTEGLGYKLRLSFVPKEQRK